MKLRTMLFLMLLSASPILADEPSKIKVATDVTYYKAGDKEMQLDIAYPEEKGKYPTVVCVHGGAWSFGNRKDLKTLTQMLAREGYVAASISYRLLPDAKFPAPVEDCKTAVRWLRANAETYSINKEKFGAVGFSAGGHLVCMLGTTDAQDGFDGKEYAKESSKVQAVISYFGPTDLTKYGADDTAQKGVFVPMLGAKYKEKPEVYQKASPISYVKKNAPPFLFLHGTKDWLVSIEHSRAMAAKLKEVGVPAELIEVKDASHGWGGEQARDTTKAALKFLDERLKK